MLYRDPLYPLYEAQQERDFGSKVFDKLLKDYRIVKLTLEDRLNEQRRLAKRRANTRTS